VLIPYSFLDKLRRRVIRCTDIPVFLYVRSQVNKDHAYPSLKKIARETGLAIRSVCRALKALTAAGLLYIEKCLKINGAFSCNSYFLLHGHAAVLVQCSQVKSADSLPQSPCEVYGKFQNNRDKSKITGVFKEGKEKYRNLFSGILNLLKLKKAAPSWHRLGKTSLVGLFQFVNLFGQRVHDALHKINFLFQRLNSALRR